MCGGGCGVSFAKVAEYRKRGAVHFHTIIRLDVATECACPACVAPPPAGFTAELLEAAVRQAAAMVSVPCPPVDEDQGVTLTARWGEELDVRPIDGNEDGELSAEQVAGYVAKYATKGTETLGVTLDRRIGEADLEELDVPAHVAELVRACWELGDRPSLVRLRLRAWAHMLGFGGHFSTRAAATPPPWGRCGGPGSPTRFAGAVAMCSHWMPGAGLRTTRP
jgi:replication initiator protein RepSA